MNVTWQGITELISVSVPTRVLAQATPGAEVLQPGAAVESGVNYLEDLGRNLLEFLPNLLGAVAILLIGLLIASIAKSIVRGILNRTNLDNQIAAQVMGRADNRDLPQVEEVLSNAVFWVVILFTVVAVLNTLQLDAVSRPLGAFLDQVLRFIPRLLGVILLLGVAWLVATIVKLITTSGLRALNLDQRLDQRPAGTAPTENQMSVTDTIGNALYWFIFLLFLLPILDTLGLQQALQPIRSLIGDILSIIPNILAAILIAAVGWLLATVVRRIVTNLLFSAGFDSLGARVGLRRTSPSQSLSGIVGTIVYVLILIPVAIQALDALRIEAISVPAIAMLNEILNVLPEIFTAALILTVAYFLGQFISELVSNILSSLGFDNIFSLLGLPSPTRRSPSQPPSATRPTTGPVSDKTVLQSQTTAASVPTRTPSEIAGIIVLVGIMLFATLAAVNILNIPALTALVGGIIFVLGRILSGLIVFAIGLFLANLAFSIINSSGDRQAQILAQVARIAIIVLVSAMALQQIGIASEIVNLAFGLILGAVAVAVALAVGLGSRDIAGAQVKELLDSFKQRPRL